MKAPPTNVAHSVRTRLLTFAKAEGEEFAKDDAKQTQWRAFMSRLTKGASAVSLEELLAVISPFLWPPLEALRVSVAFDRTWKPRGPWK